MPRVLVAASEAAALALSAELWRYSRPDPASADVTRYALPVATNGTDWGLVLPDGFEIGRAGRWAGERPATAELEKVMTRGASSTLIGRVRITMDQLATAAGAMTEAEAQAAGWLG